VCVFTPTYERAYILPVLYESLVAQTSHDFVWMIVDDGSTDGTQELVRSWIERGEIAIDYVKTVNGGKPRAINLGVSRCDPDGILTMPVDTLHRAPDLSDLDRLADIVRSYDAIEVIVGLPRHLRGGEGISAKGARKYARRIKKLVPDVRVAMVDERMTSNQAHARLRASGIPEIEHRSVIDQVAAQIILEQALELERMGGRAPGEDIILEPSEGAHV